jgi:hypothetical protein
MSSRCGPPWVGGSRTVEWRQPAAGDTTGAGEERVRLAGCLRSAFDAVDHNPFLRSACYPERQNRLPFLSGWTVSGRVRPVARPRALRLLHPINRPKSGERL